jgi:hypothetical protein
LLPFTNVDGFTVIVLCDVPAVLTVGVVTAAPTPAALVTVNVISKLLVVTLAPLTVTVAACVPALSPIFGTTVNASLSSTAIDGIVFVDNSKLPSFAPLNDTVNVLVGWLPLLLTCTDNGVRAA